MQKTAVQLVLLMLCVALCGAVKAQTITFATSSEDYQQSPLFSDVQVFSFDVVINEPLERRAYNNPDISRVSYHVSGTLAAGTPSGFQSFDLQRDISGETFYAEGSSLSFEISSTAVLSDGIQAAELVGNGVILKFNAREIDTGRYHPPLFELNPGGTGRLLNSDNIPSLDPLVTVGFGEEYITELLFDPGNLTLVMANPDTPDDDDDNGLYIHCFIATAAYGSYLAPEVKLLRDSTDNRLLSNRPGRGFVKWYYRTSPPLAAIISDHKELRWLARTALTPLVYSIKYPLTAAILALLLTGLLMTSYRRRNNPGIDNDNTAP